MSSASMIPKSFRMAILAALLAMPAFATAQDNTPERTVQARAAIDAAAWEEIEPGLSLLRASSSGNLTITAFKVDEKLFRFDVAVQEKPDGERVDTFGPRGEALVAVNGGFLASGKAARGSIRWACCASRARRARRDGKAPAASFSLAMNASR